MENLFIFLIAFFLIFVVLLGNYFLRRKRGELHKSKEISLVMYRYKLNPKKINYNVFCLICVLVNAFIIASVGTFVSALNIGYLWQLLFGFAFLFGFIYVIYGFIGIYMKRKEKKK
jgi:uncharacterized membrane protein YfcA